MVQLVPAVVFGVMILVGRTLDTIIDPTIGFMTDRCRSRRGRRIAVHAVLAGCRLPASMALLFFPPVHG